MNEPGRMSRQNRCERAKDTDFFKKDLVVEPHDRLHEF